jgi:ribosome-associated protein
VELVFNLKEADLFTPDELALLHSRLAHRLDQEGHLHIVSQEDRSQLSNKEKTVIKLISLLQAALHVQKVRKPTKTPKSVIRKRLADKQSASAKKQLRKRPKFD